jgi:hypothetical protein
MRDGLRAAGTEVGRACGLLESPSPAALEQSAGALESAASILSRCLAAPAALDCGAMEEALRLRTALHNAGTLLQSAADYHAGWTRLLGSLSAGYTARGEAGPVVRPGRVSICG